MKWYHKVFLLTTSMKGHPRMPEKIISKMGFWQSILTKKCVVKKKKLKVKTESLLLFSKNFSTVSINKKACFESVENGHEKPLFKRSQTIAVMEATVQRFSERCLLWNSIETPRKISGVVFFLKRLYDRNINFSLKNMPPNFSASEHRQLLQQFFKFSLEIRWD